MVVGGSVGGDGLKSFYCQTQLSLCLIELRSSWGFDNMNIRNCLSKHAVLTPRTFIAIRFNLNLEVNKSEFLC